MDQTGKGFQRDTLSGKGFQRDTLSGKGSSKWLGALGSGL